MKKWIVRLTIALVTFLIGVSLVQVYFPDIGSGEKLYMSFASGGVEEIEVARQILASIKFPDRSH